MTFFAKILADSISFDGVRLTTMEITFPRIVLSQFNTHRNFSRNSASSRAIPIEKMIRMVLTNPYIPTHWGKNQKGMQADEELSGIRKTLAIFLWKFSKILMISIALLLMKLGVHKQVTNRLLEPFMWHTVIVTATEWDNFFNLRCHESAHPEIRIIANLMKSVYNNSKPKKLSYDEWHLPLINENETLLADVTKISVGRCARVSYLTHDGKRDINADIRLHDRLLSSGHMSPFEHVAKPVMCNGKSTFYGNLRGWISYRKMIPNEANILKKS